MGHGPDDATNCQICTECRWCTCVNFALGAILGFVSTAAQRTRRDIRAAAIELALENGVECVTVDQIAEKAGVSRRTVFNHFPSKYDVYMPPIDSYSDEVLEAFASSTEPDLLTALADLNASRLMAPDIAHEEMLHLGILIASSKPLLKAVKEAANALNDRMAQACAQRFGCSPDDPRVVTTTAISQAMERAAIELWSHKNESPTSENLSQALSTVATTMVDLIGDRPDGASA